MKKHFTGFSKIFSFTFNQHVRSKGYKNTTIAIALICLLVPALLMGGIEYLGSDEPAGAQSVEGAGTADVTYDGIESLDRVMVVDMSQDKELDTSSLPAFIKAAAGKDVEVVNVGDDLETARRATVASDDALIMVIEQDGSSYTTNIVFPDSSGLPSETGDSFQTLLDQYTQVLAGMLSGESIPSVDENQDSAESMKDVVAMVVSYLNIMILYFFVLVYGQGVANSVVMEKSSKLMETFLISVKPTAMILGKLLAITATGIIQLLTWIISLAVSFAAGTAIVKTINPETDMFIIKGFAMLKELLDGLLSPANCIMAILMVVARSAALLCPGRNRRSSCQQDGRPFVCQCDIHAYSCRKLLRRSCRRRIGTFFRGLSLAGLDTVYVGNDNSGQNIDGYASSLESVGMLCHNVDNCFAGNSCCRKGLQVYGILQR